MKAEARTGALVFPLALVVEEAVSLVEVMAADARVLFITACNRARGGGCAAKSSTLGTLRGRRRCAEGNMDGVKRRVVGKDVGSLKLLNNVAGQRWEGLREKNGRREGNLRHRRGREFRDGWWRNKRPQLGWGLSRSLDLGRQNGNLNLYLIWRANI